MAQKKPKSENRERQNQVKVRLNDPEDRKLELLAAAEGCTKASYLRKVALGSKVPVQGKTPSPYIEPLQDLVRELNAIGNNLNQLTRSHNQGVVVDNPAISEMQNLINPVVQLAEAKIVQLSK